VRNLFLALLVANVVFFGWARWVARPHDATVAATPAASVPALELAQVPATPAAPPATTMRCRSIGPFADTTAAGIAIETLHSHGLQARARNVESSVPDGYWVYVENLKDVAARRKVIATLNAAGMKDAAAMDEAERVSVGVFSDQRHAVHRAEQVQELGFKPTLSVHQKLTSTPWLDMDIKASDPDPSPDNLGIVTGRQSGESPKVIDCPAKGVSG
jgi:hypothetical protein